MNLFHLRVAVLGGDDSACKIVVSQLPTTVDPVQVGSWSDLAADENTFDLALSLDRCDEPSEAPFALGIPVLPVDVKGLVCSPSDWEIVLFSEMGRRPRWHPVHRLVGVSRPILEFKKHLLKVALTVHPLLLTGENGTGKDLAANLAHELSGRRGRFVAVNCSAIPANLAESQLFGSLKGAYTDAENREGYFQEAASGTLFLDEIGELPYEIQAKLLRAIENQELQRVGTSKTEKVDVRLICATNRNLSEQVRLGAFRKDLYYRINLLALKMPPLRERREDIPMLVKHFSKIRVSHSAIAKLVGYEWPGNLRQLKNVLTRAQVLHEPKILEDRHLDLEES